MWLLITLPLAKKHNHNDDDKYYYSSNDSYYYDQHREAFCKLNKE